MVEDSRANESSKIFDIDFKRWLLESRELSRPNKIQGVPRLVSKNHFLIFNFMKKQMF
jgi:hypothetical protein